MGWIRRINDLDTVQKEGLYRILVPPTLFPRFGINPLTYCDYEQRRCVRFFCPTGDPCTLIEIKGNPSDRDVIFSLQISDTQDHLKMNLDFIIANDTDSPRFDVDIDEQGRDTLFGSANRNIPAEVEAMKTGLVPGQVRKGLGIMRESMDCMKHFCRMLGLKSISLEALYYHNAIVYEKYGFAYFKGFKRMKRINELFEPGGELQKRMDGSTPFRQPGMEKTIRGRTWALHDGILDEIEDEILDEPWHSPEMYLMIDKPRDLLTFPDGEW